MNRRLGLMVILAATPVQAGQPISESLVDCGTLFDLSNRAFPERRETEKGASLAHASDQFLTAAREQARAEGRASPERYVEDMIGTKEENWDGKGLSYVFSQDFRDWIQYCRSLSDHLGVDLTAP